MKNKKINIDLKFKFLSPFTSAVPGTNYYDFEKARFGSTKGDGFPCTRTATIPFATTALDNEESEENAKRANYFPIIPVNTLRGILRRNAADMIINALAERQEVGNLHLYHILTCGAHSSQPAKVNSLDIMRSSATHPYLGVFGGGPQMSPSFFSIGNGMPITNLLIEEGVVPEFLADHALNLEPYQLTKVTHIRRVDDLMEYKSSQVSKFIENYEESVNEWFDMIGVNKDDRSKSEAAKKLDLQNITCQEFVIPGSVFHSRISFDPRGPADAGLGLLLHAIKELPNKPIGLKVANGFGQFALEAFIEINGRPVSVLDGSEFNMAVEPICDALDACAEFLDTVSVDSLNALFTLDAPEATPAPAKKKAKAKA